MPLHFDGYFMNGKEKLRIAVLASTSGSDLPAVFAMDKERFHFVCLITNKSACGAREKAKSAGVPDIYLDSAGKTREEYDEEILRLLRENSIGLVLLIGWMRILSKKLVDEYFGKMMNVHPSLLPAFGGGMDLNVHEEVLKSGVKITGATIHFVTEEADSGPIILQKTCEVADDDTSDTLKAKVQKLEQEMFPEAIRLFADGKIEINGNSAILKK